jgi:hypothetical protein
MQEEESRIVRITIIQLDYCLLFSHGIRFYCNVFKIFIKNDLLEVFPMQLRRHV